MTCRAIRKDGSTVVTGPSDKTKNFKPKGTPMNNEDGVTCLTIYESGSMFVAESREVTVCRWNIKTSAMIEKSFHGHESCVRRVSVDGNSETAVSGSADKALAAWHFSTGKQKGERMCEDSDVVISIAISS